MGGSDVEGIWAVLASPPTWLLAATETVPTLSSRGGRMAPLSREVVSNSASSETWHGPNDSGGKVMVCVNGGPKSTQVGLVQVHVVGRVRG